MRANEIAFHRITGNNLKEMPYANQQIEPTRKSSVKERLISRALLSANRRHTCGMIPIVINSPPPNPRSSCQVKVHLLPKLYMKNLKVKYFLFTLTLPYPSPHIPAGVNPRWMPAHPATRRERIFL